MPPEYTTLFNAITDAIRLLQEAQIKAEELVIERGGGLIFSLQIFNPRFHSRSSTFRTFFHTA